MKENGSMKMQYPDRDTDNNPWILWFHGGKPPWSCPVRASVTFTLDSDV